MDSWFMPKQEHRAIEILPIAVGSVSWAAPLDSRVTLHCETEVITPALSLLWYTWRGAGIICIDLTLKTWLLVSLFFWLLMTYASLCELISYCMLSVNYFFSNTSPIFLLGLPSFPYWLIEIPCIFEILIPCHILNIIFSHSLSTIMFLFLM